MGKPVSNSNDFYAKTVNCLEATRNAASMFGSSGFFFSMWWYTFPVLLAKCQDKPMISRLMLRGAGVILGGVALVTTCAGLHQTLQAAQPSKENPACEGWKLDQRAVSERVKFLGAAILVFHAMWYFASPHFCVPLNMRYAVHALFAASVVCNSAAYVISQAKGDLELPDPI